MNANHYYHSPEFLISFCNNCKHSCIEDSIQSDLLHCLAFYNVQKNSIAIIMEKMKRSSTFNRIGRQKRQRQAALDKTCRRLPIPKSLVRDEYTLEHLLFKYSSENHDTTFYQHFTHHIKDIKS